VNATATQATKTQPTAEVSCGEFRTSQHCHVAGHTAEFVKYDSLVGVGISQQLEIFQFRCPTDAGTKGMKAEPSVSPKPRRLCCLLLITPHGASARLWVARAVAVRLLATVAAVGIVKL
jgi:hypothetical protein